MFKGPWGDGIEDWSDDTWQGNVSIELFSSLDGSQ